MDYSKKSFLSVIKSVFMVFLCAVIISMPILDAYRAHAISETVAIVGGIIACAVAVGVIQGAVNGATYNLTTDAGIRQKFALLADSVVEGGKKKYRMSLAALQIFKCYLMDRLGLAREGTTSAASQTQPTIDPNVFHFDFAEYPASNITYNSDGTAISSIAYDASFLSDHIIWETANTAQSIDSREDSYYSSLDSSIYFTGSTTRSGSQVSSNAYWTMGDLRYKLSASGSTYNSTVRWKVFEPLYFINQATGNRELLLCAVMLNRTGTSNPTSFTFASTPVLDVALNTAATDWYYGLSRPPLVAEFGNFNPSVNKTYSTTAQNYREYSYQVYSGVASEPTTSYEPVSEADITSLSNDFHYDPDYDVTKKLSSHDVNNTYINIEIPPTAQKVAEDIEAETDFSSYTTGQQAQYRDLPAVVHKTITVGGTVTRTEAVTGSNGEVVTPEIKTVTDSVPLNQVIDVNVTDNGQYQGVLERIFGKIQSLLDTLKSIPYVIYETAQYIVDSIDYQINPNSPQFPDSFMTFFTSAISSAFPSISLFRQAFDRFTAADSPLVLEYDIVLGNHQYHFSVDFSWFEAHRARFRSGVGVMFWLLAWLGVIRGFMSIFHVSLGKVGGIAIGNTGAGGSSGASSLDVGGSGSLPVDSVEYGIWKRQGRL